MSEGVTVWAFAAESTALLFLSQVGVAKFSFSVTLEIVLVFCKSFLLAFTNSLKVLNFSEFSLSRYTD